MPSHLAALRRAACAAARGPALLSRDSLLLLPQIVTARLTAVTRKQGLQPQSQRPPQRSPAQPRSHEQQHARRARAAERRARAAERTTRDVAARAGLGDSCVAALAAIRPG